MKLGGKLARLREPHDLWVAAGGDVRVTRGGHLRWSMNGRLAFFSAATSGFGHAKATLAKVRKHLQEVKKPR
jgi:hypothetical protein